MNHRDLLKRYIRRVMDSEGCTFIPNAPGERTIGGAPTVDFTPEEIAELKRLEEEGEEEERSRIAAAFAFLEKIGAMPLLREEARKCGERLADMLIMGDPTQTLPMGILSRGKSVIDETLQGARGAVVLMDEISSPRFRAGAITLHVPGESTAIDVLGPLKIEELTAVPEVKEGNRATRRKRRRMSR
jgi:hypothetical protein